MSHETTSEFYLEISPSTSLNHKLTTIVKVVASVAPKKKLEMYDITKYMR